MPRCTCYGGVSFYNPIAVEGRNHLYHSLSRLAAVNWEVWYFQLVELSLLSHSSAQFVLIPLQFFLKYLKARWSIASLCLKSNSSFLHF